MAVTMRTGWRSWLAVLAGSLITALLVVQIPGQGRIVNVDGLLAVITGIVTLAPIVRRMVTGTFDIMEPIVWGCAMLFVLFAVRPIITLVSQNFTFQGLIDIQQGFGRAVLLGTVGSVAFVVAYELWPRLRQAKPRIPGYVSLNQVATRTAVIWLVGIGAVLYLARLGINGNPLATLKVLAAGRSVAAGDTNSSAYLSDGPILFAAAATILAIRHRAPLDLRERLIIAVLMLAAIGAFALLGNRRLIIPSAATPIIAYCLANRRRPRWRTIAIVLPIAFVILAAIPYERYVGAREEVQGGAAGILVQSLTQPFQPIARFFDGVDTEMVPDLALEVQTLRRPSDYYFGRATFGDLLLSPIPSALVPGKPQSARNDFLIRIFGNPCDLRIPGALCPDFSVIGTFYQDFWFVGVFVGMVLMGVFSAALWKRYQERQTSSVALVLAASWTVSLPIIIRAGFMPSFQWWLEFIVPALLGLRIARGEPLRRRRRVRPRARPVPARTRYHRADPVIRSRSQR